MSLTKMMMAGFAAAAMAFTITPNTVEAATVGVSKLRINVNTAHSSTLQVNELVATPLGGGADLALASAGATVTSSPPLGAGFEASNVIDGLLAPGQPGFYHGPFNPADFVEVTLAAPATLESVTIFGRRDGNQTRDSYILTLFDIAGTMLFQAEADARSAGAAGDYSVTVQLPSTVVPVPAALPMLLGALGLAGFVARRKSA